MSSLALVFLTATAYADLVGLFAGPGSYTDGTKSTPLVILELALQDAGLRDMLVTVFTAFSA
jgi:hypothetical protein